MGKLTPIGLLTMSLVLTAGGCAAKLPYNLITNLDMSASPYLYYSGTVLIILGSIGSDTAIFDLMVNSKRVSGIGTVAAAGLTELATGLARILCSLGVGLIGGFYGAQWIPYYFYGILVAALGLCLICLAMLHQRFTKLTMAQTIVEGLAKEAEVIQEIKENGIEIKPEGAFEPVELSMKGIPKPAPQAPKPPPVEPAPINTKGIFDMLGGVPERKSNTTSWLSGNGIFGSWNFFADSAPAKPKQEAPQKPSNSNSTSHMQQINPKQVQSELFDPHKSAQRTSAPVQASQDGPPVQKTRISNPSPLPKPNLPV